jgi:hypothetical protein
MLDDLTTEAAVLRVYRQAFAMLAREAGAMILDTDLIDVDEAILEAFAAAGSDGLTAAEVVAACHRFDARVVERRLGVLRDYRAISKVVERPNEQHYERLSPRTARGQAPRPARERRSALRPEQSSEPDDPPLDFG